MVLQDRAGKVASTALSANLIFTGFSAALAFCSTTTT
jgi:hypothetical protein